MFKSTNFSVRLKSALSGFQKAHDELSSLRKDVQDETKQTQDHLQKLQASTVEIDKTLDSLAPFVSTKK